MFSSSHLLVLLSCFLFFISPKTAKCYAFFEKNFIKKIPCRCGAEDFAADVYFIQDLLPVLM